MLPASCRRSLLLFLCAATAGATPVFGQQLADGIREFCLRGAPLPHCRWFTITEVGVAWLAVGTQPDPTFQESRRRVAATWNLGLMRNLTPRTALGAALVFSDLDADESRAGVQVRYRHWVRPTVGLEGAAGVLLEANDVATHFRVAPALPGFTGEVRLEWRDLVGGHVRVDLLRAGQQRIVDLSVGGRAGAGAGAVGLALLAVITVIGIATLD